jgi:putative ABC transport system ATP-binding protein
MILAASGLTRRYDHADGPIYAVRDVDLDIEEGRFVTITGPSGSGKSTLLLLLGGLVRPTAGEIRFRDLSLHDLGDAALAAYRRDHVGFVMQNFSLVPYLTAMENVLVPLGLARGPSAEKRRKAEEALDAVGLSPRRRHLPRELSVGQQQRVAIARAFATEPDLVFADEPTGNLDPSLSDDILDLLARMNAERGTTIVMVTHSPDAARRGDVRIHLEEGRLSPVAVA